VSEDDLQKAIALLGLELEGFLERSEDTVFEEDELRVNLQLVAYILMVILHTFDERSLKIQIQVTSVLECLAIECD
jgi:hypothetical protein